MIISASLENPAMGVYQRGVRYLSDFGFRNTFRKLLYFLLDIPASFLQLARKIRFYFYTNCWISHIIGKVHIYGLGNNVKIARGATLYSNVIIEIGENANLQIGENFTLSYGSLIACRHSIAIGDHVMIGEYTSIRDTTHSYTDTNYVPYCKQPDQSDTITIGKNVWIGRGSIILPGTIIEDGVIIGANSVVKGHLQAYGLFAGSPARFLKMLTESTEMRQALNMQNNQHQPSSYNTLLKRKS